MGHLRRAGASASWSRCSRASTGKKRSTCSSVLLAPCALPARFYRRAACWRSASPAPGCSRSWRCWSGSTWLGLFSYRHVDYAHELWWQFVLEGDAPRFLRATAGVMVGIVVLGGLQLIRFAPPERRRPSRPAGPGARRAVLAARPTRRPAAPWPCLATSSCCSATAGAASSCSASRAAAGSRMGDAIGPADERLELLWRFRERCDRWGGRTVFYEVGAAACPIWSSSASPSTSSASRRSCRCPASTSTAPRVRPAPGASVAPSATARGSGGPAAERAGRAARAAGGLRRLAREQGRQGEGVLPRPLRSRLPRRIPDRAGPPRRRAGRVRQSLAHARTARDVGRPDALSRPARSRDVMDYLFVAAAALGQGAGLRSVRPRHGAALRACRSRHLAPIWTRAGALLFRHGEKLYNFEGLRRYKDKFKPVWEPRYLAAPGGLGAGAGAGRRHLAGERQRRSPPCASSRVPAADDAQLARGRGRTR